MTIENNSGTCKQPEKQDGCSHLVDEYKGNIFLDQNETCLNGKRSGSCENSVTSNQGPKSRCKIPGFEGIDAYRTPQSAKIRQRSVE